MELVKYHFVKAGIKANVLTQIIKVWKLASLSVIVLLSFGEGNFQQLYLKVFKIPDINYVPHLIIKTCVIQGDGEGGSSLFKKKKFNLTKTLK